MAPLMPQQGPNGQGGQQREVGIMEIPVLEEVNLTRVAIDLVREPGKAEALLVIVIPNLRRTTILLGASTVERIGKAATAPSVVMPDEGGR